MSELEVERLRALSTAAFGQRYRLECMLAISDAEDGLVNLTDLAATLGVSVSNLQQPLRSLLATGLITLLPNGDSRRKFYLRNDSAAWAWARELRTLAVLATRTST